MSRSLANSVAIRPQVVCGDPRTNEATLLNANTDSWKALTERGQLVAQFSPMRINGELQPALGGYLDRTGLIFAPDGQQTVEMYCEIPDVLTTLETAGTVNYSLHIKYVLANYDDANDSDVATTLTANVNSYVRAELETTNGTQELYSASTVDAATAGSNVITLAPGTFNEYEVNQIGTLGGAAPGAQQVLDGYFRLTIASYLEGHTLGAPNGFGTWMTLPSQPPYLGILSASLVLFNAG